MSYEFAQEAGGFFCFTEARGGDGGGEAEPSFSALSEVRVTSEEGSEVEGVMYTVASMGKVKSNVPRRSSKVPQLLFRGTSRVVVESRIIWRPISKVPLTFGSVPEPYLLYLH